MCKTKNYRHTAFTWYRSHWITPNRFREPSVWKSKLRFCQDPHAFLSAFTVYCCLLTNYSLLCPSFVSLARCGTYICGSEKNRSLDFQIDGSRNLFGVIQWDRYHMKAVCLYFFVFQPFEVVFVTKQFVFWKTCLTSLWKKHQKQRLISWDI